MLTVGTFLKRLFPNGTTPQADTTQQKWSEFPLWPPDLFAAAASLVDRSGCYSHPRYTGDNNWLSPNLRPYTSHNVQHAAHDWNKFALDVRNHTNFTYVGFVYPHVRIIRDAWGRLIDCPDNIESCKTDMQPLGWCDDAMRLLAIADEASAGIGFFFDESDPKAYRTPFLEYWMSQYLINDLLIFLYAKIETNAGRLSRDEQNTLIKTFRELLPLKANNYIALLSDLPALVRELDLEIELPYLTNSLCQLVPSSELCVQPKTRTTSVGCTVRSLSHHLALLPPISQVETFWRVPQKTFEATNVGGPQALNILLIPFPYTVAGECFIRGGACIGSNPPDWDDANVNRARFFSMKQTWLNNATTKLQITASDVAEFICSLIDASRTEVTAIHGVILPELALEVGMANSVSEILSTKTDLEFFIAGVLAPAVAGRGPKNSVHTTVFAPRGSRSWEQAKHHRWKLEHFQIRRYNLGGQLNPHFDWWEGIDISPRECYFGVFRHGACLTALVCEDLARVDPVQTVIRSIAPNLVVALLMDGPQLESRWPGRYATVLADDPGCAVLTITSVGLFRRSHEISKHNAYNVALWKEAGGDRATELTLPTDHHALLLTLTHKMENVFTLDGRPDVTKTVTLSRSGAHPIKLTAPPPWLSHI